MLTEISSMLQTPTLKALEGLEELREALGGELLVVLGGHLHADLQVLANVCRQHGPQALQRVLHRQGAEVVHTHAHTHTHAHAHAHTHTHTHTHAPPQTNPPPPPPGQVSHTHTHTHAHTHIHRSSPPATWTGQSH